MRTPALASLLAATLAAPALAQSPAYVGTWGSNLLQCVVPQELSAAPMILERRRFDQHETHCAFTSVRKAGKSAWRVRSACSVEGDRQRHTFTIAVEGNAMTMRDAAGARNFVRCP